MPAEADICFSCFSSVLALSQSSLHISLGLGAANFLCHLLLRAWKNFPFRRRCNSFSFICGKAFLHRFCSSIPSCSVDSSSCIFCLNSIPLSSSMLIGLNLSTSVPEQLYHRLISRLQTAIWTSTVLFCWVVPWVGIASGKLSIWQQRLIPQTTYTSDQSLHQKVITDSSPVNGVSVGRPGTDAAWACTASICVRAFNSVVIDWTRDAWPLPAYSG